MRFVDASAAQQVVFGADELDRLDAHLAGLGIRRALLCTSPTYLRNGTTERVQGVLGERVAAVFDAVRPHVPVQAVAEAVQLAMAGEADGVVALGGGSSIGTGKAVVAALSDVRATPAGDVLPVPLIAIPTTYAGSEMTPVYGVTRAGRKTTTSDPRALPRLVLYDPALTLDLPPALTASTAANALAHAVEGAYSRARTPLAAATALAAIGHISEALPRLMKNGEDGEAREALMVGAHLAGVTLAHAGMALHHAICHALGGTAGVPHGVANAIMLPHVLRFNVTAALPELAAVGRALGASERSDQDAAEDGIDRIAALFDTLPLPHRLRDAGVALDTLPDLAALALASSATRSNPRSVASVDEIAEILRVAW
jgi:maleylacetate reductase